MAELNWSDAQWQKVKDSVTDAFNKASVASALFGPLSRLYGPVSGATEIVRNERLELLQRAGNVPFTVRLNRDHDAVNLRLVNLTVNVELSTEDVSQDSLPNAVLAFQDAASILALEQDLVVFAGYKRGFAYENSPVVMNQVDPQQGLADLPARRQFQSFTFPPVNVPGQTLGQLVVGAVVNAMNTLEGRAHPAPFACVLGDRLFEGVQDPSPAMVLPADRLTNLLKGGPVLRSGRMDAETGIVVSLAANAIDVVIGTPPTIQFLQRTLDARFLFRVHERFVLRIRDDARRPVTGFRIRPSAAQIAREGARVRALRS